MLASSFLPIATMSEAAMRAAYNSLAEERGRPRAKRDFGRFELGKGIALLRTYSVKPPPVKAAAPLPKKVKPQREPVTRNTILKELARVVSYRCPITGTEIAANLYDADLHKGWRTVGQPYPDVLTAVKKLFPNVKSASIRVVNHIAKTKPQLFEVVLPNIRPQLKRKATKPCQKKSKKSKSKKMQPRSRRSRKTSSKILSSTARCTKSIRS